MKTAVLISGQLRTFAKCYPTQKWQIFRHYEPDIHFFVSCVDDAQADSANLLTNDYPNDHVNIEVYDDPTDLPVIPLEAGDFAPYANAAPHSKLMLQHWGNKKVWDLFQSKSETDSFNLVIRIRPDLWIHRFQSPRNLDANECFAPWWGKFGGINDRLAIISGSSAYVYFNLLNYIPTLLKHGCPFHPETLLAENLRLNGVQVYNMLLTEFSTERLDGSRRWAEIVMSDIAELIASR